MTRILLTILLFYYIIGSLKADLGAPTIQAICKTTLKDGKIIEGIITFGPGGYDYNYRPHGFCFAHDNGTKQLILYNLKFGQFTPENQGTYRTGTSKLYYVENISKERNPKTTYEFDDKERILKKKTVENEEYKLLDEMVMYKKLPLTLYVGYDAEPNENEIKIKVSEIKSVELIKSPSDNWLNEIKNAKEKLQEQMKKDIEENDNAWTDYIEPSWYHDIIKDEKRMNYLMRFF